MKRSDNEQSLGKAESFLSGKGEMWERIRSFDWSKTALGPISSWSPSLKMMVRFLLANRFPMLLWWGPQFVQIYNDAYIPVLGSKHPDPGLGRSVKECWSEIWHILRPLIETPFKGGESTWMEDILLEINRYGFIEESHFTIAYSPVPDETVPGGIGGVLATVHEITEKVIGERRVTALRDLSTRAVEAKTPEEACTVAAGTLTKHPKDIPFAMLYLVDHDGRQARLASASGVFASKPISPLVVDLAGQTADEQVWPLVETIRKEELQIVDDLISRFGKDVPRGAWSDRPNQAVIVPVRSNIAHQLAGLLVAGISPRLKLDDSYRSFIELAAGQIATAIANARAYEEEKRRAEALAEIDRAKTAFFSNVSHEFRTPLTLMLGPLDDAISTATDPAQKQELEIVHRNGLRLLKLVNSLLDFSRIEAGRVQATYEPTDLATLTAELASVFRSAIEKVGLRLIVDCPPLPARIYVDHEMWEKIVLNLLSNAFKFTFEGSIIVSLRQVNDNVELRISDTGTGIAKEEMTRLFERFHTVRGSRSRTHEGSGIGLALVRELAKLHGGNVSVESEVGKGTTFTVSMPTGSAHLPDDRVDVESTLSSTKLDTGVYVEEALSWLRGPDEVKSSDGRQPLAADVSAHILLADDNADMREYVKRILGSHWAVEAVSDGNAALRSARERVPDLILTDVMMPGLDGFELLSELRSDSRTRDVPVILLSARAGEESRVEGLEAGADDYLVKPFSARELIARVGAHLAMAQVRQESTEAVRKSEERFRAFVTASSDVMYCMSADWSEMRYLEGRDFIADTDDPSQVWLEKYIHPNDQQKVLTAIKQAIQAKKPFELEHRVIKVDGALGWTFSRAVPLIGKDGKIIEWFGAASDVTERKQAEEALRLNESQLQGLFDDMPIGVYLIDEDFRIQKINSIALPAFGDIPNLIGKDFDEVIHVIWPKEYADEVVRIFRHTLKTGEPHFTPELAEERLDRGVTEYYEWRVNRLLLTGGRFGVVCYFRDISLPVLARREREKLLKAEREAREASEAASRAKDEFLATVSHELRSPLNAMLGWGRLLSSGKLDKEMAARGLKAIEQNAKAQAQLIEDLLDVSRIISGKFRLNNEAIKVAPVVEAAIDSVRPTAEARSVRLQVTLDPDAGPVLGDGGRLQQVVWNLLSNAVKFTPKGGRVQVGLLRINSHIEIVISDTGQGIAPEFLPFVFDRFRQADGSNTRPHGGLGLGLAIVRHIVELHGGTVEAQSDGPGHGAKFTVKLPLMVIPAKRAGEERTHPKVSVETELDFKPSLSLEGIKVLVVDDEPDALLLLSTVLTESGAYVKTAASAEEGFKETLSWRPNVIVSDIGMPRQNGYEFIKRIRAWGRETGAWIPAVALTAYARAEDRMRALSAGFQIHVPKPVEPAELITVIASVVERPTTRWDDSR